MASATVHLVLYDDLETLMDRLDRIQGAVELGCISVGHAYREEVATALVDTCWEGIRLGHELTRRLAYDGFWGDLDTLAEVWLSIGAQTAAVTPVHPDAARAATVVDDTEFGLAAITSAVASMDQALGRWASDPNPSLRQAALRTVATLEAQADRFFMRALAADVYGRLDAAHAVLTTVAARAARERATVVGDQA